MAAMVRIAGRPERRELADQSLGVRNIKSGIAKNGNILSGKVRFSLIAVCRRSLQLSLSIRVKLDRERLCALRDLDVNILRGNILLRIRCGTNVIPCCGVNLHAIHVEIDGHIAKRGAAIPRADSCIKGSISLPLDVPRDTGIVDVLFAVFLIDKRITIRLFCIACGHLLHDQRFNGEALLERHLALAVFAVYAVCGLQRNRIHTRRGCCRSDARGWQVAEINAARRSRFKGGILGRIRNELDRIDCDDAVILAGHGDGCRLVFHRRLLDVDGHVEACQLLYADLRGLRGRGRDLDGIGQNALVKAVDRFAVDGDARDRSQILITADAGVCRAVDAQWGRCKSRR